MAHKSVREYTGIESTNLQYEQNGFDYFSVDNSAISGLSYLEIHAGKGTIELESFADGTDGDGTDVAVTSTGHGLLNGDEVTITGTTNYNGTYTVADRTTNTFDIETNFIASETTGNAGTIASFTSRKNQRYIGLTGDDPHWIAIQNCGSVDNGGALESVQLQAQTVIGDDFAVSGTITQLPANDLNLNIGDILYGNFKMIRLRITSLANYHNRIRLIRGA